jgi:hypothetical protein
MGWKASRHLTKYWIMPDAKLVWGLATTLVFCLACRQKAMDATLNNTDVDDLSTKPRTNNESIVGHIGSKLPSIGVRDILAEVW